MPYEENKFKYYTFKCIIMMMLNKTNSPKWIEPPVYKENKILS